MVIDHNMTGMGNAQAVISGAGLRIDLRHS
jgi:hypothetical protein